MFNEKLIYFLLLIVFSSCNNNRKNENQGADSSAHHFTKDDSSSIFSATITDWLNENLKTSATNRKITLEERWNDDSLQTEPFAPEPSFYKNYHSVLHWSADSAYVLDIGSYGMLAVTDNTGNIQLEAGEPDTEIAIIDAKNNKRTRLMYVGPSSTIINGRWLNNTDALVLGTFLNDNRKTDTLLWFINVKDNLFRLYNLKSQ